MPIGWNRSACVSFLLIGIVAWVLLPNINSGNDVIEEKRMVDDCERFNTIPTAKQFFNDYVAKGKPVIFTNLMKGNSKWDSILSGGWSNEYLRKQFAKVKVKVSVSPTNEFEFVEDSALWPKVDQFWSDFAQDSDISNQNEFFSNAPDQGGFQYRECTKLSSKCARFTTDKVLVRPAQLSSTLGEFMNFLESQRNGTSNDNNTIHDPSYYIQYESIPKELEQELSNPSWANFLKHDLTGLWLGIGPTKANLHFDMNENLMWMVSGSKKWTLYDPEQSSFLYEGYCKEGMMKLDSKKLSKDGKAQKMTRSTEDNDNMSVFNSPVTIDKPDFDRFPLFHQAKPKVCHLQPGEVLYLPAFWWHQVESFPDEQYRTLGVNYWYSPYRVKPVPCPTCALQVNYRDYPKVSV